jgi:hypothetical protein
MSLTVQLRGVGRGSRSSVRLHEVMAAGPVHHGIATSRAWR